MSQPIPVIIVTSIQPYVPEANERRAKDPLVFVYFEGSDCGFRDDGNYFHISGIMPAAEVSTLAAAHDLRAALEELVEIAEQRGYQPDWLLNAHAALAKARGPA